MIATAIIADSETEIDAFPADQVARALIIVVRDVSGWIVLKHPLGFGHTQGLTDALAVLESS